MKLSWPLLLKGSGLFEERQVCLFPESSAEWESGCGLGESKGTSVYFHGGHNLLKATFLLAVSDSSPGTELWSSQRTLCHSIQAPSRWCYWEGQQWHDEGHGLEEQDDMGLNPGLQTDQLHYLAKIPDFSRPPSPHLQNENNILIFLTSAWSGH